MPALSDCEIVKPNEIPPKMGEDEILNLIAREISEFCREKSNVLFIVNDDQRATPTSRVLKKLNPRILKNSKFLVATGAHKAPSENGMRYIFGELYDVLRNRIIVHDAHRANIYIGTTKFKNDVYINEVFHKNRYIVIITSVEPHYFAGYTGGRKSILPGITSYGTIERNHKLALDQHAQPLALDGNPVHEDMMDSLRFVSDKDILCINCVLDRNRKLFSAYVGDIRNSFFRAVEDSEKIYAIRVKEKADIVITEAQPPLDINLYQAHKAIEHGKLALKEGGVLILVAKCEKGIGPENFYNLLKDRDPEDVIREAYTNYKLGYHKAARLAQLLMRAEIYAVTNLSDEVLKRINIKPYHTLHDAYRDARKKMGRDARAIYLVDGATTIPITG